MVYMPRKIVIFIFLISLGATFQVFSAPRVIFINPGYENNNPTGPFWANFSQFMQTSAHQLELDLTIHYAGRDHLLMKRLILQSIKLKPDYLLLVNEKGAADAFMTQLDQTQIKVMFLLNEPSKDITVEQHQSWLANVIPNNHHAGYLLTKALHQQARMKHGPPYTLLAVGGNSATQAARDRYSGLETYISQHPQEIQLIDLLNGNWSEQQALKRTQPYFSRLGHIDILWAANDPMAKGAY